MQEPHTRTSLTGLTVLVTRPLPQAQSLANAIQTEGGEAFIFPCIEILPPDDLTSLHQTVENLAQTDLAIFISPNAVTTSLPLIQKTWSRLPEQLKISCIGEGSAATLAQFQIPVDFLPEQQFNSEGLLALPELQQLQGKRIVIFKGQGGRELLTASLKQRGAEVIEAITYQRKIPCCNPQPLLQKLAAGWIKILTCTSSEILTNLITLAGKEGLFYLQQLPLLVISEAMQLQAVQAGFQQLLIAPSPTDQAIITTLLAWYKRKCYDKQAN